MRNTLRRRLLTGETCANGWLSMPSGYAAEMMARCGWDSLTVDLQHGVQDYMSLVNCFQGAASSGVPLLARVPSNEVGIIGKVLDAGAWGVICPMVNSATEAAAFVSACYYTPKGARSNGPNRAAGYAEPGASYQSFANDEVLAIPMIETVAAVAALEEILDVPGVSGVYIGPSDLAFTMGYAPALDWEEAEILAVYHRVLDETAKRGQFAGIHCLSPIYGRRMAAMGFRFVTMGSDASLMAQAARDCLGTFRADAAKA
jgi:4-hydroxy-2-oxoheptanedioate aldolase